MQNPLTPEAIAGIAHELAVRSQRAGPYVLGAQLGKLVNDALQPQHVREFGGLRSFTQNFLPSLLKEREGERADDLVYEIVNAPPPAARQVDVPHEFEPVAGADLWRFFSNPNLACQLAVRLPSTVLVGPRDKPLPEQASSIHKISAHEYRALANQFLQEHSDNPEIAAALSAPLMIEDFYKPWISALRRLRRDSIDLLKSWEILRTATVSASLTTALSKAGVDASRVAEIVQVASPVAKAPRAPQPPAQLPVVDPKAAADSCLAKKWRFSYWSSAEAPIAGDDVAELRLLVHRAIDQMSAAELREIRISAGTLLKVNALKAKA